MDSTTQFQSIDRATLTPPVRNALRSKTAELLEWTSARLPGGEGNPVSPGLHRFSGTGEDQAEEAHELLDALR